MRLLPAVMVLGLGGCVTPRIAVEQVIAKASVNEVAASRSTNGADVFVAGKIEDITFLVEADIVTTGSGHSVGRVSANRSRSSKERRRVPYVSIRTPGGNAVFCFPQPERVADFDVLEKGKAGRFLGTFHAFSRGDTGDLRVSLGDCRIAP